MAEIYVADLALSIQVLERRKEKLSKIIGELRAELLVSKDDTDLRLQVEEMEDYAARIGLILEDMHLYLLEYWENQDSMDYFLENPSDDEMELDELDDLPPKKKDPGPDYN